MLDRCITDNKCKEITKTDKDYCITYNYEYLEDYIEEDNALDVVSTHSYDSSNSEHDTDDEKQE